MQKRKKIYEGKTKILFEGPEAGTLIQYFKDDINIVAGDEKTEISGKGILNNAVSSYLLTKLNELGLPTHFTRKMNMREQLVKSVEIIPIKVVVRNIAAGSFSKRYGIEEGTTLPRALIECFYKKDELGDPLISEDYITAFGLANLPELDEMLSMALRVNDYLSGLFLGIGFKLVDFKLEFGRWFFNDNELRIVLADEISPDTCRLIDIKTNKKFGSGAADDEVADPIARFRDIAARLGVFPDTAGNTDNSCDLLSMADAAERASKNAQSKEVESA